MSATAKQEQQQQLPASAELPIDLLDGTNSKNGRTRTQMVTSAGSVSAQFSSTGFQADQENSASLCIESKHSVVALAGARDRDTEDQEGEESSIENSECQDEQQDSGDGEQEESEDEVSAAGSDDSYYSDDDDIGIEAALAMCSQMYNPEENLGKEIPAIEGWESVAQVEKRINAAFKSRNGHAVTEHGRGVMVTCGHSGCSAEIILGRKATGQVLVGNFKRHYDRQHNLEATTRQVMKLAFVQFLALQ